MFDIFGDLIHGTIVSCILGAMSDVFPGEIIGAIPCSIHRVMLSSIMGVILEAILGIT